MCRRGVGAILDSNTKWICGDIFSSLAAADVSRLGFKRRASEDAWLSTGARSPPPGPAQRCAQADGAASSSCSPPLLWLNTLVRGQYVLECNPFSFLRGFLPSLPCKKPFAQTPDHHRLQNSKCSAAPNGVTWLAESLSIMPLAAPLPPFNHSPLCSSVFTTLPSIRETLVFTCTEPTKKNSF